MLRKVLLTTICALMEPLLIGNYNTPKNRLNSDNITPIYSEDFSSYDGKTAVDSFAWNNLGMICDASTKSIIDSGENIDGYSIKVGGQNFCCSNNLLAFKDGTIPLKSNGSNRYTTTFDIKVSNASKVGFSYLVPQTDNYIGGLGFVPNKTSEIEGTHSFETITKVDDYYHVSFDIDYDGTTGVWAYFYAVFDGAGYVVIDNINVSISTNKIKEPDQEKDFSGYKYNQTFQSYDGVKNISEYLWYDLCWASDATIAAVIDTKNDDEAITNKSLKVGQLQKGIYHANQILCSGSGKNPFDTNKGTYTIEFDIKLFGVNQFTYQLKENNTDAIITSISFKPSDLVNVSCTSPFYSVTEEDGVIHVEVDAITETSTNWSDFILDLENNGYMVIDNIAIKKSEHDYKADRLIYKDDFENYNNEENISEYLWRSTHLYSDSSYLSIKDCFDGKALVSETNSGTYGASTYVGLQGTGGMGSTVLAADTNYEITFDINLKNVTSFGYYGKYVDPRKGDLDLINFIYNPKKQTYQSTGLCNVKFTEMYNRVILQFKSPANTNYFGYFVYTCDNNAVVILDNYQLKVIKNYSIPMYKTGFEDCNLGEFTPFTNYYKKEEILGKVTTDNNLVINGSFSAICGFDATNAKNDSEKWNGLISRKSNFDKNNTYSIQFRFNVVSEPEHYFYLEVGGIDGLYLRFNKTKIVDSSSGVVGSIIKEDTCYVLQASFNITQDLEGLLIGSYGGGFIVIDDFSLLQGEKFDTLPAIEKKQITGEKYISEDFESNTSGEYFDYYNFVSVADAFGAKNCYNDDAINGYSSANIYSGCRWGAQIKSVPGLLNESTIYTLCFRYKPLDKIDGNISVIISGQTEKYLALTLDGRVSAFTKDGTSFYDGIDLADVKNKNGYYEAYITFETPMGNPQIIIGTYGACSIAIDDICLYYGAFAQFDTENVSVIKTADKSKLSDIINRSSVEDSSKYTSESIKNLEKALSEGKIINEDLKASEKEINEAIEKIKEAYNALVRKDVLQFQEAIASIDKCNSKEEMYKAINNAIDCFNSVEDKEMVTKEHEILIQKINEYNDYVDKANSNLFSLTSASHLAAAISLSTMISLLFVFITRRISL